MLYVHIILRVIKALINFADHNLDMTQNEAYDSVAVIKRGMTSQMRQIELQPCSAYAVVVKGDKSPQ